MSGGDDRGDKRNDPRTPVPPEEASPEAPPLEAALRALNPRAAEEASGVFAALSPPHTVAALERALDILTRSTDAREIVAIPEIRAQCSRALVAVLPLAARSEDGLDLLAEFQRATGLGVKELPPECNEQRRAAYLESIKSGDLQLIMRAEAEVLVGLTVPTQDVHAAVVICCMESLKQENSVFQGDPVEGLLRYFAWTDGFDVEAIRGNAAINLERERQFTEAIEAGRPHRLVRLSDSSLDSPPSGPEIDPALTASRIAGFQSALKRGDCHNMETIKDRWTMPAGTLELSATRRAALEGIARTTERGEHRSWVVLCRVVPGVLTATDEEFAAEAAPVLERAIIAHIGAGLNRDELSNLLKLNVPHTTLARPLVRAALTETVLRPALLAGDLAFAREIATAVGIDAATLRSIPASREEKATSLAAGVQRLSPRDLRDLLEFLDDQAAITSEPRVVAAAERRIITAFQDDLRLGLDLGALFPATCVNLRQYAVAAIGNATLNRRFTVAMDIAATFFPAERLDLQHPSFPPLLRTLAAHHEIDTLPCLFDFVQSNSRYVAYLKAVGREPQLSKTAFERLVRLGIAPHYAESVHATGELGDLSRDAAAAPFIARLKQENPEWGAWDFQVNFAAGEAYFGAAAMLRFVAHPEHSPSHCVRHMSAIVRLAQASGLTPEQFTNQILLHVRRDGGEYPAGSAYAHLASTALLLEGSLTESLAGIERSAALEDSPLAELRGQFTSPAQAFRSWSQLKRLEPILDIARHTAEFAALRAQGLKREVDYLVAISMRPDSRVDPSRARALIEAPNTFFGQTDSKTADPIQTKST
jgi:hypothetical protein